jgi:hypothetical protein
MIGRLAGKYPAVERGLLDPGTDDTHCNGITEAGLPKRVDQRAQERVFTVMWIAKHAALNAIKIRDYGRTWVPANGVFCGIFWQTGTFLVIWGELLQKVGTTFGRFL